MELYNSLHIVSAEVCLTDVNRFGSFSQNALVYKFVDDGNKYIIKTTPLTSTSENELLYINLFSNIVKKNETQHFPLCYKSFLCSNVDYNSNLSLYRKFFDDMSDANRDAIKEFLEHHIIDSPMYSKLLKTNRLAQAWKMIASSITDEHLRDYFIVKGLGKKFVSRIFCMEMAEMDLRMYLANNVGTWDTMKQICETLKFVYNLGFHHNDVHPGNILLMDTEIKPFVLLWDFEKMMAINAQDNSHQLYDLISLFNSFNSNKDSVWEPKTAEFIRKILSKEIHTWNLVEDFIQNTTPDNI